jgi:hypothetical protein
VRELLENPLRLKVTFTPAPDIKSLMSRGCGTTLDRTNLKKSSLILLPFRSLALTVQGAG